MRRMVLLLAILAATLAGVPTADAMHKWPCRSAYKWAMVYWSIDSWGEDVRLPAGLNPHNHAWGDPAQTLARRIQRATGIPATGGLSPALKLVLRWEIPDRHLPWIGCVP